MFAPQVDRQVLIMNLLTMQYTNQIIQYNVSVQKALPSVLYLIKCFDMSEMVLCYLCLLYITDVLLIQHVLFLVCDFALFSEFGRECRQ